MMEAEGKYVKYVMNGNWMMGEPGSFEAAGTTITYDRKNHAETLKTEVATTKDIYIMVCLFTFDLGTVVLQVWFKYPKKLNDDRFKFRNGEKFSWL